MTSAVTDTLELPAPFDLAQAGASIARTGRRSISWTLHTPGELHRNVYAWGHLSITEDHAFRSEPLRISGQRRLTEDGPRTQWTDKALRELHQTLVLPIQRYGFTRIWGDLHQRKSAGRQDAAVAQQQRVLQLARWWQAKAELDDLYAGGMLEIRPLPETDRHTPAARTITPGYRGPEVTNTVASLWFCFQAGSEQMGWLTDSGDTAPLSPRLQL